jgi:hypothetical protein
MKTALLKSYRKIANRSRYFKYLEYDGHISTPEGFLVNVSIDEYEKGRLEFLTNEERVLGELTLFRYRELKMQPLKEWSVYVAQTANIIWSGCNLLSKLLMITPVVFFWWILASATFGIVDLSELLHKGTITNVFLTSINLSALTLLISYFITRGKNFGRRNLFRERFRKIIETNIKGIKDLHEYKMRWKDAE